MKETDIFLKAVKDETEKFIDSADISLYEKATRLICDSEANGGRLHITGIGKPAHIAGYIASLISSTGTPAYFLHGTEAVHGSCGQLNKGDVVICISNSGETAEMKSTAIAIRNNGGRLIAVTGNPDSWLATYSDVHLPAHTDNEGGPLNRAPRTSILAETICLQLLSVILQTKCNLTPQDYVLRHPGGTLGRLRENEK